MSTTPTPLSKSNPQHAVLAGELYTTYCKAVGGFAFNGDPLPSWEEFVMAPTKEKQVQAWIEVAVKAFDQVPQRASQSAALSSATGAASVLPVSMGVPGASTLHSDYVIPGTTIIDVAAMMYAEHYTISSARGIPLPPWCQLMSLPGNDREIARWIRLANKVSKALNQSVANNAGSVPKELLEISTELERAIAKFPTWPTDALHAVGVVAEELGELQKEVMQLTYEPERSTKESVRKEAVQLAAMSIRFLRSLEAYQYERRPQHHQSNSKTPDPLQASRGEISKTSTTTGPANRVTPPTDPAPPSVPVPGPVCDVCGQKVSLLLSPVLHANGSPLCLLCAGRVLRNGGCGIGVNPTSNTASAQ